MKLKTMIMATSIGFSSMAFVGSAQATALATSILDITGFQIQRDGVALDAGAFSALVLTDTADISASLNGITSSSGTTSPGTGIDLPYVNQGVPVPAYTENTFSMLTNPPVGTFSLSDQIIAGAPITGLDDGAGGVLPLGAQAGHGAYVALLDGDNDGSAAANNGLNATFNFVLAEGGAVDFVFDARAYLEAFTSATEVFPGSASAAMSLSFTIDNLDAGTNVVTWTPDGIVGAGGAGAIGIAAETDPFSLNDAISRNAPFNGTSFRGAGIGSEFIGSWSGSTVALLAGVNYQLTIRSTSEADALTSPVPEPASIALIALGLIGMTYFSRRRQSM